MAFRSIGFEAKLILNRLRNERAILASSEEQDPNQKPESAPKQDRKDNPEEQRQYIDAGLNRIAEFERRASGGKKGRR